MIERNYSNNFPSYELFVFVVTNDVVIIADRVKILRYLPDARVSTKYSTIILIDKIRYSRKLFHSFAPLMSIIIRTLSR